MPLIQKDKANERSFKTLTWVWNYAIEDDLSLHKWPEVLRNSCLTNWCSQLKFSPCSSKYSIVRFRNASLLTVSVSQTTHQCLLTQLTAHSFAFGLLKTKPPFFALDITMEPLSLNLGNHPPWTPPCPLASPLCP